MDIFKIVGVGIITALCFVLTKENRPEIAYLSLIAGGIIIFLSAADYMAKIIGAVNNLAAKTGLGGDIILSILKIIGVGYITEFGAGACEDMGAKSVADKVLFGGRMLIMFLSLPILMALFELISGLLA